MRISLKAGSPEGLLLRTGADPTAFDLPFRAIEQLLSLGFRFHVAAMSDPAVMPAAERAELLSRLSAVCHTAGKRLLPLDSSLAPNPHERTDSRCSSQDSVLLDEETYVPVFPHILARTLDVKDALIPAK